MSAIEVSAPKQNPSALGMTKVPYTSTVTPGPGDDLTRGSIQGPRIDT
jgi:hypothetical protein